MNSIEFTGIIEGLAEIERMFEKGLDKRKHSIIFQTIFSQCSFSASVAEKSAIIAKFENLISDACSSGLKKYHELIPKAVTELEHRLRYEPMLKPAPFPAPVRARYDADDVTRFFGALPGDVDHEVIDDWSLLYDKWNSIPEEIKKLGIGPFWDHPDVLKIFPDKKAEKLRRYAKWWGSRPTSSVAMERVFAIMRSMEGPQRMALSRDMIRFEMKRKCNPWIADRITERIASTLPPLK